MPHWKLILLCSAVGLAACKGEEAPPRWSDIEGVPDGFKDGQDDTRRDEEIRAVAYDEPTEVARALEGRFVSAEADPAYAASTAATITPEHVTAWDALVTAGDHRSAGYLTTEADPKVGTLGVGSVPAWSGTALVKGTLHDVNGKVGIGTDMPSALLTVSTLAKFGAGLPSATRKSCAISGTNWTHTPPSNAACATYCDSRGLGFVGGTVTPEGSRTAIGSVCDYISDFETCTKSSMPNNQNCDSRANAFVCTCLEPGTELTGKVRVMSGNVGIGVAAPNSPLHVGGYLQLGTTVGQPPAEDCDSTAERGRILMDPGTGTLWACANSGWLQK